MLKTREIAAFVMEPILCNLGGMVPDAAFVSRMRELCRKYGTLFVADEVACGFGRSGRMFACEHFDLDPDILCVGKAITGGHAAMGATLGAHARERLTLMPFASKPKVRGLGFIIGVELEDEREAKRVKEKCREHGLLLAFAGEETLQLFPSLTLDAQTLDDGLDIIGSCVGGRRADAA